MARRTKLGRVSCPGTKLDRVSCPPEPAWQGPTPPPPAQSLAGFHVPRNEAWQGLESRGTKLGKVAHLAEQLYSRVSKILEGSNWLNQRCKIFWDSSFKRRKMPTRLSHYFHCDAGAVWRVWRSCLLQESGPRAGQGLQHTKSLKETT